MVEYFILLNEVTENFVKKFFKKITLTNNRQIAVSHSNNLNYKQYCKHLYKYRQKQRSIYNPTPDKYKPKEVLTKKWVDPKRIKRQERKEKQANPSNQVNKRKPKLKYSSFKQKNDARIALSHSGDAGFFGFEWPTDGSDGNLMSVVFAVVSRMIEENSFLNSQKKHLKSTYWQFANMCFSPKNKINFPKHLLRMLFATKYAKQIGPILDGITDVAFLYGSITSCKDYSGIFCVLMTYLRRFKFFKLETYMPEELAISHSGPYDAQSAMDFLHNFKNDWNAARENPLFKHVHRLLVACVSMHLIDASCIPGNKSPIFKRFFPLVEDRTLTCIDLIDAILSTIICFGDYVNQCASSNSFKPLLGGSRRFPNLEKRYREVRRIYHYITRGVFTYEHCGMTLTEYETELTSLRSDLVNYKQDFHKGMATTIVERYISVLDEMYAVYISKYVTCMMREAPFTLNLFGTSGVGKTTVASNCIQYILKVNNLPCAEHNIARVDPSDKFESTLTKETHAIILDDVANTLAERNNGVAITDYILRFINNTPCCANKAAVEEKGTIPIRAKMVVITSNVPDMGGTAYSVSPISIVRRASVSIEVRLLDEYVTEQGTMDSVKVCNLFPNKNYQHIYKFRVYRGQMDQSANLCYPTVNHTFNDGKTLLLHDIGWHTLLRYLKEVSAAHYYVQSDIVEKNRRMFANGEICECCSLPEELCLHNKKVNEILRPGNCYDIPEQEFCPSPVPSLSSTSDLSHDTPEIPVSQASDTCMRPRERQYFPMEEVVDFWSATAADRERFGNTCVSVVERMNETFCASTQYLHRFLPGTRTDRRIIHYFLRRRFFSHQLYPHCKLYGIVLFAFTAITFCFKISPLLHYICIGLGFFLLIFQILANNYRMTLAVRRATQTEHCLTRAVNYLNNNRVKCGVWACEGFIVYYIIAQLCKYIKKVYTTDWVSHGNIQSPNNAEIDARDAAGETWLKTNFPCFNDDTMCKNVTSKQLIDVVNRGLRRFVIHPIGKNKNHPTAQLLMISNNFALAPAHTFENVSDAYIEVFRTPMDHLCHVTRNVYSPRYLSYIPNTDLALLYLPNLPPVKNLIPYFPNIQKMLNSSGVLLHKNLKDEYESWSGSSQPGIVTCRTSKMHCKESFAGNEYKLDKYESFPGLCGAIFVCTGSPPSIIGVHLGAYSSNLREGVLGFVNQETLRVAIGDLLSREVIPQTAHKVNIGVSDFGKTCVKSFKTHRKSPANHLAREDGPANCEVIGQGGYAMHHRSECIDTPIKESVRRNFDVKLNWRGPLMHVGWPFTESLKYSARTSVGFLVPHLLYAYRDFSRQLSSAMCPSRLNKATPLSDMQIINGIDGLRFIDALDPTTSTGFPLNCPKGNYMTMPPVGDSLYKKFQCPRILDRMFFDRMRECEDILYSGNRIMSIFSAQLKDEPVLDTKMNVRVFQAAPLVLSMLMRKYFLPIARLLSIYPLLSECAVGINAVTTEWDQLHKYISKYGEERVLAGDYSKYDLRMSPQLIGVAYKILIELAEKCNYQDRDIMIMKNLVTEVTYPIVQMNGCIIQLYGSNPSGHNLTVYINSIANSLIFRCAFYHLYNGEYSNMNIPFNRACSMITYGDDVISSVSKKYPRFNFKNIKLYLHECGMKFTTPDKTDDDNIQYFHMKECEFLKRKSNYIPELGLRVGKLNINSIYKSLCCILKSKSIDPIEVSRGNMRCAMHEFFFHGREIYDDATLKMRAVCNDMNFDDDFLNVSFDDRVDAWFDKYKAEILLYTSNDNNYRERLQKIRPQVFLANTENTPSLGSGR